MVRQLVVNVAQPFQGVLGQTLGFVAQQHDDVTRPHLQLLAQPAHQRKALVGDRLRLGMAHACSAQQGAEEGPFKVAAVVLARHAQHQDVRAVAGQVQRDVVDRVCLAHAGAGMNQRTRNQHADAVLHQVNKLFDGGSSDPVVPAHQGVVLQCQRGRLRGGPHWRCFFRRCSLDALTGNAAPRLQGISHECLSRLASAFGRNEGPGPTSRRQIAPMTRRCRLGGPQLVSVA